MKIARFVKLLVHFICAGLISAIAAILMHTQMVLAELIKIDIKVPIADRLYMSTQDLIGLLPKYGVVVLLGLAIAFVIAKIINKVANKFVSLNRLFLYPIAGGVAMLAIMLLMQPILNITLLAGARSALGMSLQVVAGIVGGFIFAYLRKLNSLRHSQN